jgi:hypothetical protein
MLKAKNARIANRSASDITLPKELLRVFLTEVHVVMHYLRWRVFLVPQDNFPDIHNQEW